MGYCNLLSFKYFQAIHQSKLHAKCVISDRGSAKAVKHSDIEVHTYIIIMHTINSAIKSKYASILEHPL